MIAVSLGKTHGFRAKPHSALRHIFVEQMGLAFWGGFGQHNRRQSLVILYIFWIFWIRVVSHGKSKNPKYLENEKRCHGVSHILTRYRFIGFFGSWLGGGLSLSPSIVKARVAGWWSLSVSFYR